jgi:tetratricopeptide (TPR) repeat protein
MGRFGFLGIFICTLTATDVAAEAPSVRTAVVVIKAAEAVLKAGDAAGAVELADAELSEASITPAEAKALHAVRGRAHLVMEAYSEAVDDLTAAIGQDTAPKDVCAALGDLFVPRGDAYMGLRKFRLASEDFARAAECEPDSADVQMKLGMAYFYFDREQAVTAFNEALKLRPNDPHILELRGKNYENMGKSDLAIADYTAELRLKPNDAQAYNNRATAYNKSGLEREALADFDKSIELDPTDFMSFLNRADLHYTLGEFEAAKADLKKAQELYQNPKVKADLEKKAGIAFARSIEASMARLEDDLNNLP